MTERKREVKMRVTFVGEYYFDAEELYFNEIEDEGKTKISKRLANKFAAMDKDEISLNDIKDICEYQYSRRKNIKAPKLKIEPIEIYNPT